MYTQLRSAKREQSGKAAPLFQKENSMRAKPLKIYHLYHHQPEPLPLETVNQQAWLVNNGITYSLVAIIQARSVEEAYLAIQEKMAGRGQRRRFVELRANMLRATLPGDVLVEKTKAWMVMPENKIQSIPYEAIPSWKSYAHRGTVRDVS